MSQIEFWFEFASTYSHIAAQLVEAEAATRQVEVVWRPFLLGPIFREQGLSDSPFNLNRVKGDYMWRDVARECERLDVPFRRPGQFPRNGLLAARISTAGEGQDWMPAFVRGVYRANFVEDLDISNVAVLEQALIEAGAPDPGMILEDAGSDGVKRKLRHRTDEAMQLGIFGAPSFRVGKELFWGGDRLQQALDLAERR